MKHELIMENWRKYINESDQSGGILLYHGTCFPPESFADGIDSSRAQGFGQGEGFYFWTNKERAIKHTTEHILKGKNKQEVCPQNNSATGYLVISDEPITPENFDIDYEIYTSAFATFILNNLEYFFENREDLGIVPHRTSSRKTFKEYFMEPPHHFKIDTIASTIRLAYMADPARETSAAEAEALGILASKLAKIDSEMFRDFEAQALPNSTAVKYNGEKILYPLRIEDLEGNIVWSRENQSFKSPEPKGISRSDLEAAQINIIDDD